MCVLSSLLYVGLALTLLEGGSPAPALVLGMSSEALLALASDTVEREAHIKGETMEYNNCKAPLGHDGKANLGRRTGRA